MIQKQNISLNFAKGLDTKTDPKQVAFGNFLSLQNMVFTEGNLLKKRNGYAQLPPLPEDASYVTTFNTDLTAIGTSLQALPTNSNQWVNKGAIQPVKTSVLPLIRNNLNQTQSDTAIAANGFICTVYTELNNTTNSYKYAVADSTTGQNILAPTALPSADPSLGTPRVFYLGTNFIIVYTVTTGFNTLVYLPISSINPVPVGSPTTITTSYTASGTLSFDGVVLGNNLYLAWEGDSSSGVKMLYLTAALSLSATTNPDPVNQATMMSLTSDVGNNVVWASYYDSGTSTGYTFCVNSVLAVLSGFPIQIISSGTILNITSSAQNQLNTIFYEVSNADDGIQTNFVSSVTVPQITPVASAPVVVLRSIGLASKSFIIDSIIYFAGVYSSSFQPTYFLVNGSSSTSTSPVVIAKLAYENGGGYLTTGLPSVNVNGNTASFSYLFKDLIQALANADSSGTTTVGGVYSQTGINLAKETLTPAGIVTSEIGTNLNISGGFLWAYDGYSIAEQGFHLWPDSVQATPHTTGGFMTAQQYYYQVTYEWTDNQGNAFRSAGSIPITVTTTGAISSVKIVIPTLRITAKTSNPVKIVIYRWSAAQQIFYQTTSIIAPILNDTTADSVTYIDVNADTSTENSTHFIQGNNILYTTGGVIEDIGPPGTSITTLFDDRLWLVDSEDPNLLWFSKQVIEATPVEMSDLLTVYVAPTIGSQGSTGPITALGAMDDKLIIFKENAIYYINGTGPDNTGANNQYSQPIFITATVGCTNPASVVFIPNGLMFQSDKGIWLLGRNLETSYIGAPVEDFNSSTVQSAVAIPGTNQVRFTIDSGITLMYDYYYGQWGTFANVPAVSSTLYQGLHTYINQYGKVLQESPGLYLDGSSPVLMSFVTSWLSLSGLNGYQRAFFFYLLGEYITPFKLQCLVAYDFNPAPVGNTLISPTNAAPVFGGPIGAPYGTGVYGGPSQVLNWRVFLARQRCNTFQITINEFYDPSLGIPAGEGFSLSGINLVYGMKKGFKPQSAANSAGTS